MGHMVSRTSLYGEIDKLGKKDCEYPNSAVAGTALGILAQGKSDFESVNEFFEEKEYYSGILGIKGIPSEPTFRQRLNDMPEEAQEVVSRANVELLGRCEARFGEYLGFVPIDIDVTTLDNRKTKKEGVSRTYKGFDGFAPMLAYMGTEGYAVGSELRPGSQHSQNGTGSFLEKTLRDARALTDRGLLLRADAAHDSIENIDICYGKETRAEFIIKRNLRKEPVGEWLALAMEETEPENVRAPREGKTVYVGSAYRFQGDREMRIVYEVTVRTIKADGQILLAPEIEAATFWTSLPEPWESERGVTDAQVLQAYRDHATCEQFHSEIKTDMDLERLPSGSLKTNKLLWCLGMMAYNILRIMGQASIEEDDAPLKRPVKRRRIRTVIQNLVHFAVRVVRRGRRVFLNLGRSNAWRRTFKRVHLALAR